MRRFPALFLVLSVFAMFLGGCANLNSAVTTGPITNQQQLQAGEQHVKVGAVLATKAILVAVSPDKAVDTANAMSNVANAILNITDENTDLTQVRLLTNDIITQKISDPKVRAIVSELADTIAILVQQRLDAINSAAATTTQSSTTVSQHDIVVGLIRAAAAGVNQATLLFRPVTIPLLPPNVVPVSATTIN